MTRSMRVMFLVLIAALAVGYVELRSTNEALAQRSAAGGSTP